MDIKLYGVADEIAQNKEGMTSSVMGVKRL